MEPGYAFQPPRPVKHRGLVFSHSHPPSSLSAHRPRETEPSNSLRRHHLRRTFDLLHVLLQRRDTVRAARALKVLMHAHEWRSHELWRLGLAVLSLHFAQQQSPGNVEMSGEVPAAAQHEGIERRIRYMRSIARTSRYRLPILLELIPDLISLGRYTEAMEELDLVIQIVPYKNNPTLHVYLGLLTLHSATESALARSKAIADRERAERVTRALQDLDRDSPPLGQYEEAGPPEEVGDVQRRGITWQDLDHGAVQLAVSHFENAIGASRQGASNESRQLRRSRSIAKVRKTRDEGSAPRAASARPRSRSRSRAQDGRESERSTAETGWGTENDAGGTTDGYGTDGAASHPSSFGGGEGLGRTDENDDPSQTEDEQKHLLETEQPWPAEVARSFLDFIGTVAPHSITGTGHSRAASRHPSRAASPTTVPSSPAGFPSSFDQQHQETRPRKEKKRRRRRDLLATGGGGPTVTRTGTESETQSQGCEVQERIRAKKAKRERIAAPSHSMPPSIGKRAAGW